MTRLFGEDHPFGLLDSFKLHLGCAQLAKISLAEYRNKRAGSRDRFLLDCTYQYSCFRLRSRKQASNMSFVDCAWGAGSLYGDADKILEQQTWTVRDYYIAMRGHVVVIDTACELDLWKEGAFRGAVVNCRFHTTSLVLSGI